MTLENIRLFKVQTLRAIAQLYKSFPTPTTIDHSALLRQPIATKDGGVIVEVELEGGPDAGTILWLYGQGFVDGNLQESKPLNGAQSAAITNAQLTTKALRILEAVDPNTGAVLGEFAVASAFGPSEIEAADLLYRQLLAN